MNLPDYFAICASGPQETDLSNEHKVKLAMVEQASRTLTLDFSMETLQEKHLADSKLFEYQSDML